MWHLAQCCSALHSQEARRRARLQNEEEELALMLAVSASEAEAVAATMAEPIQLEDARAITAAQSELDRGLATAEAERAGAAGVRDGGGNATATAERPAGVRASRSASSAGGASFCETIPEAAGEEQSAEPQVQSLRGRYSAVETAEQDMYTEAEQAAYQKIQQHAAMQRSKFAPRDAGKHAVPLAPGSCYICASDGCHFMGDERSRMCRVCPLPLFPPCQATGLKYSQSRCIQRVLALCATSLPPMPSGCR